MTLEPLALSLATGQGLVLFQLADFAFQGFHLLGLLGRDTATLAGIDPDLLDPFIQGLRRATDLRGNRYDCRPTALMLPGASNTIRTARSRTSPSHRNSVSTAGQRDEYLFVVFVIMRHPTQELQPPANTARFK